MSSQLPRLAYIGVGLMGLPMVKRLISLGYPVSVFDILPAQVRAAELAGARAAISPADATRGCEFVLLNLPTTDAVKEAMFDADGVASAVTPPQLVIDFSTVHVDKGRAFAATALAQQLRAGQVRVERFDLAPVRPHLTSHRVFIGVGHHPLVAGL